MSLPEEIILPGFQRRGNTTTDFCLTPTFSLSARSEDLEGLLPLFLALLPSSCVSWNQSPRDRKGYAFESAQAIIKIEPIYLYDDLIFFFHGQKRAGETAPYL